MARVKHFQPTRLHWSNKMLVPQLQMSEYIIEGSNMNFRVQFIK